jgi:type II secretory pathway component PulJ
MPYLMVALVVTAVVLLLAWRGLGTADGSRSGTRSSTPRQKNRAPRVVAPDDDADFLGEIDRKLRGEDKSS